MSSLRGKPILLVLAALAIGFVLTVASSWVPSKGYDAQKQEEWVGWPIAHTRLHVYYDTIPMGSGSVEKKYVELGSPPLLGNVVGAVSDIIIYAGIVFLVWFLYKNKREGVRTENGTGQDML